MQGGDGQKEGHGHEADEQHALGLLPLNADGLFLDLDDAVASSSRHRANAWFVFVLFVGIDQDVLKGVTWEKFRHGAGQHGFARAWVTDHQHVTALFCRLTDDDGAGFLADDLIDQAVGNGDLLGGGHAKFADPRFDGGLEHIVAGLTEDGFVGGVPGFRGPNRDLNVTVLGRHRISRANGLVRWLTWGHVGLSAHG